MEILSPGSARGHVVQMAQTNAKHLNSNGEMAGQPAGESRFADKVTDALERVSGQQMEAAALFEKMLTHPDSVETQDVTIAMAQAEMSLNITKTIVDRAVKAYNDITTMR